MMEETRCKQVAQIGAVSEASISSQSRSRSARLLIWRHSHPDYFVARATSSSPSTYLLLLFVCWCCLRRSCCQVGANLDVRLWSASIVGQFGSISTSTSSSSSSALNSASFSSSSSSSPVSWLVDLFAFSLFVCCWCCSSCLSWELLNKLLLLLVSRDDEAAVDDDDLNNLLDCSTLLQSTSDVGLSLIDGKSADQFQQLRFESVDKLRLVDGRTESLVCCSVFVCLVESLSGDELKVNRREEKRRTIHSQIVTCADVNEMCAHWHITTQQTTTCRLQLSRWHHRPAALRGGSQVATGYRRYRPTRRPISRVTAASASGRSWKTEPIMNERFKWLRKIIHHHRVVVIELLLLLLSLWSDFYCAVANFRTLNSCIIHTQSSWCDVCVINCHSMRLTERVCWARAMCVLQHQPPSCAPGLVAAHKAEAEADFDDSSNRFIGKFFEFQNWLRSFPASC